MVTSAMEVDILISGFNEAEKMHGLRYMEMEIVLSRVVFSNTFLYGEIIW